MSDEQDDATRRDGPGEPDDVVGADDADADDLAGDRPVTVGGRERKRAFLSRAWRPALAVAAAAGLVWGTAVVQGGIRLGGGVDDADSTVSVGGPAEQALVESAALACPGPEPLLHDEREDAGDLAVRVLAAGAPRSVLDAVPPPVESVPQDRAARTADAATTTAPGPDARGATAAPDTTGATAGPDGAGSTTGPDQAATTAGEAQESTGGDAAATSRGGDSVLRTTDGAAEEALKHGIPVGVSLEGPASAVVTARGDLAPGVLGGLLGAGNRPGGRGATLAGCVAQGETGWLVGGDDAPGRTEQLVLTNPGTDTVTVEVSVWGADGPVETTGAGSVVVPAGGRTVEVLDALAPGADAPVVRVRASGGPVVAHLAEYDREGTTDRGAELVSTSVAPATDLVVPALPQVPEGHEGQVVLRLAAPGTSEAVIDLTALTADGAVRLADRVTRVPAGSTVDVVLDELPEGAVALRLRADHPVVAGARLAVLPSGDEPVVVPDGSATTADPGGAEHDAEQPPDRAAEEQAEPLVRPAGESAWVAATQPSTSPTGMALPDRALVPGGSAELALSAVDGTTAWVTWVDETGEETASWVDLPNDTTVVLPVPQEARAVWVVGAGPAGVASALHVAGADELGPYVAAATLPRLPWGRQVTQVRPEVP